MSGLSSPTLNKIAVLNLSNSIIGVSILTLPYTFKLCGPFLSLLLLSSLALVTYLTCSFLIRTSSAVRRRSYEHLVQYAFGFSGKSMVELSIIGINIGACVAYFVVIGDVLKEFLLTFVTLEMIPLVKNIVMCAIALGIIFPMGLIRDISNFGKFSFFSILFYVFFVLYIVISSLLPSTNGIPSNQLMNIDFTGVKVTLPIYSLAFACHSCLFPVFSALDDESPRELEIIVRSSVTLVLTLYSFVGFFGYILFGDAVQGDVLKNFGETYTAVFFKVGFAASVIISFPLAIFPARTSIDTLLFSSQKSLDQTRHVIPNNLFRYITFAIIAFSLAVGIIIPHIETVSAFMGSSIGIMICMIWPSLLQLNILPKSRTNLAKGILLFGLIVGTIGLFTIFSERSPTNVFIRGELPESLKNDPAIMADYLKQLKEQAAAPKNPDDTSGKSANKIISKIKETQELQEKLIKHQNQLIEKLENVPLESDKEKEHVKAEDSLKDINNENVKNSHQNQDIKREAESNKPSPMKNVQVLSQDKGKNVDNKSLLDNKEVFAEQPKINLKPASPNLPKSPKHRLAEQNL